MEKLLEQDCTIPISALTAAVNIDDLLVTLG